MVGPTTGQTIATETKAKKQASRSFSLKRAWLWRQLYVWRVLESSKPDSIRSFLEKAKEKKVERSIPPELIVACLLRLYCGIAPSFRHWDGKLPNPEGGRKVVIALGATIEHALRRSVMRGVLNQPVGDVPLDLIQDMVAQGFRISGKEQPQLAAHTARNERDAIRRADPGKDNEVRHGTRHTQGVRGPLKGVFRKRERDPQKIREQRLRAQESS